MAMPTSLGMFLTVVYAAMGGRSVHAAEASKAGPITRMWNKLYRGIPAPAWSDHHSRYKFRAGDGTARRLQEHAEKKRRLMDVTDPDNDRPYGEDNTGTFVGPRTDGKAKMNGELYDYSGFDCPWESNLDPDYPAMCLPYQEILSPFPDSVLPTAAIFGIGPLVGNFSARDANYAMPDGSSMECSDRIEALTGARCAAGNSFVGHGAICEGWVEDCTFSKPKTRKSESIWQSTTRCNAANGECTVGYEAGRLPYPDSYPGNNGGSFIPSNDDPTKCTKDDSALQWLKCGIPCPAEFAMKAQDLLPSAAVCLIFIIVCLLLGVAVFFKVKGDATEFFVAGRNLPVWILVCTLGSQCLDASSALGNLDLAYKYHFWDGAALPLGLGLSLIIVGVFLAKPLNEMKPLTLPDCFARVYGPATEILCSLVTMISFIFLLAGNLVGCGKIVSFLFDMDPVVGIAVATFVIWSYSAAGGLLSVAYTDVIQALVGWTGFLVVTIWIQQNMPNHVGVSAAYPVGDSSVIGAGATDPDSYDPIPNAIFFNWATVIVLAFGNCMALDFQARCFAAKTPRAAQLGCIIAGLTAGTLGIINTLNAGTTRALYGPSSQHAEFVANSCSADITVIGCFGAAAADPSLNKVCNAVPVPGVPTCGEWKPDPYATLKMLTCSKAECHLFMDFDGSAGYGTGVEANYPINGGLGCWYLLGIVAASMSTADGAIVALGTVFSHNVLRKTGKVSEESLLNFARASTLLFSIIAGVIAMTKPNDTGYFLIVAFDIVFAAGVVPLFALVYWKGIKPEAGFVSLLGGAIVRVVLEFALPKDGLLLWLGKFARNFGPGIEDPEMFDESIMFGKLAQICPQENLMDMTGFDSLVSPVASLLLLVVVQLLPIRNWGKYFQPVESSSDESKVESSEIKPPDETTEAKTEAI